MGDMTSEPLIDEATGEVMDSVTPEAPSLYVPGTKSQANLTNLARVNLTGLEFRVLFAIGAQLTHNAGTISHCTVQSIAEALERNPRGIEKIFASLKRKLIIERIGNGQWAINPRLLYRGSFSYWGREYPQAIEPSYEINSNGLDGKKQPRDYNRTLAAPTGDAS